MADTAIVCPTCQHPFDPPQNSLARRFECPRCRAAIKLPPSAIAVKLTSNLVRRRDRPERAAGLSPGQKACLWTIGIVVVALTIKAVLDDDTAPPAVAVVPTTPDAAPVTSPAPPSGATAIANVPLEKRRAIYQLYCSGRDIAFMAWFEAQPLDQRLAWKAETPEFQANAKEVWTSIHHRVICETIAPFLAGSNLPVTITPEGLSTIVREGRSQHWPERPFRGGPIP